MDKRQEKLVTEKNNYRSKNIDIMKTKDMLKVINQEDKKVIKAIKKVLPQISQMIDSIWVNFQNAGRLIYVGAGSSGRIGVLDASEINSTFGTNNKIIGIIAGGKDAITQTEEGAEDNTLNGVNDLLALSLNANDVVLGICASGKTPYVISALNYAKSVGALAFAICMNQNHDLNKVSDNILVINTGPEVISGSTRLKAGSATKMILNMISTTLMIKLGKVYQNYMIDLTVTNKKLEQRAINIVQEITGASHEKVINALRASNNSCRHAIIMLKKNLTFSESELLLEKNQNNLRQLIE